jgi:hypothetical protein
LNINGVKDFAQWSGIGDVAVFCVPSATTNADYETNVNILFKCTIVFGLTGQLMISDL